MPLTNFADLPARGQWQATFRFELVDIVTGYRRTVTPLRSSVPQLSHDTSRTIKRQITGIKFGRTDSAMLNTVSSRLEVFMIRGGVTYPLGRYRFQDQSNARFADRGILADCNAVDEMIIVDQPIEDGFAGQVTSTGVSITLCSTGIDSLMTGLPVTYLYESSPWTTSGSWPIGTSRGYALEQLAIDGNWFSPYFGNDGIMRFIRIFDPATVVPDFNYDTPGAVIQGSVLESNDFLSAPNRYIVVGNGPASTSGSSIALVGSYDVPSSAPFSIANRGFVIPKIEQRQIDDFGQANAIAAALALRAPAFQRVQFATIPDPRHDSYNTFIWQGVNWLELSWSLPLVEGGIMQHVGRRLYS